MFVHAVYFWLRTDLSSTDREHFVLWLPKLRDIPGVREGYIGVPAPTDRSVVERGYSYAMTLVFDDAAAEEAYQVHPVHDQFREECHTFWTQVRVFDSVSE
jgi:hypothetical protein